MKYVILDVDTGIDDALALAYAIQSPALHVLGLTTSFGNHVVDITTENTLKVLEILGATDIPVAKGAGKPLLRSPLKANATHIHGEDGIGNTYLPKPKAKEIDRHAADFIIEQVRKYPKQVTLITVASQTNLALAIMKDPEIVSLVKRVVIMGGAVTVPGNVTPVAEANIYTDPEAAELVFQSGIPITLVGLDVTMQTLLTKEHTHMWRESGTPVGKFLASCSEFYMDAYAKINPYLGGCALHDPLAVGVVIDPSFVQATPMYVSVDTEGSASIGRTIGDRRNPPKQSPNMDVCLQVDVNRFVSHFLQQVITKNNI
ncbi:nucleoside hydrolase [Brevibacillus laterosporus]|uniref:nucleoside hydrolase n=1 Tax=Brevibacillus laterosporus TaxID=1465 RepID=UPI00264E2199|nr:nucleoside hydrolase [Brevibacillus laterosporus]MDN9008539.1 nucleoside hydrolase [Brevibacillus laterosporus]MDO0939625.1 nucleoside hydrolase [Brevibacillus laterosporus]